MKILKLFVVIAILLTTAPTFAQVKLGHINSADLVQLMPGMKEADSQLDAYQKSLEEQLNIMVTEYQKMIDEYKSKEKLMTDIMKEVKQKEIGNKEKLIQDFQQTAQDKVSAKREELFSPILKKAEQAIKDVAKEKGYAYVFDTSTGGIIYAQDSDNIMDLVKAKLGITAATPVATPATPK